MVIFSRISSVASIVQLICNFVQFIAWPKKHCSGASGTKAFKMFKCNILVNYVTRCIHMHSSYLAMKCSSLLSITLEFTVLSIFVTGTLVRYKQLWKESYEWIVSCCVLLFGKRDIFKSKQNCS